jgi:hypothetical protein
LWGLIGPRGSITWLLAEAMIFRLDHVKSVLMGRGLRKVMVLGFVLACCASGCQHAGQTGPKVPEQGSGSPPEEMPERIAAGGASSTVPTVTETDPKGERTPPSRPGTQTADSAAATSTQPVSGPEVITRGPEQPPRQSEQGRVERAARELAADQHNLLKVSICFVPRFQEWWVVLYEDLGHSVEVKKYTWNFETEKLERFLVLERVPHSKLNEEDSVPVKGGTCQAITVDRAGSRSLERKSD